MLSEGPEVLAALPLTRIGALPGVQAKQCPIIRAQVQEQVLRHPGTACLLRGCGSLLNYAVSNARHSLRMDREHRPPGTILLQHQGFFQVRLFLSFVLSMWTPHHRSHYQCRRRHCRCLALWIVDRTLHRRGTLHGSYEMKLSTLCRNC